MEVSGISEVYAGDVGGNSTFCAVGQYDSKLLDPHSRLWLPAVSRRRGQRHEHWRVAAGNGDLQCLPAEQSSPLSRRFAAKPRQFRIRLWILDCESYETDWLGESDRNGCAVTQGRSLGRARLLARSFSFSETVQSFAQESWAKFLRRPNRNFPAIPQESNKSRKVYQSTGNESQNFCRWTLFETYGANDDIWA